MQRRGCCEHPRPHDRLRRSQIMPSHRITTAFSYVRFSSKKQEQGDSRRRQTDGRAAAYCKRRGWALSPQTYEDLGVSAFKGKNALVGNLGEFLKAVRS